MVFPEFDLSLIGRQEFVIRFTDDNQTSLFKLLHDNGCKWGSGDSLMDWSAKFYTDEDGCHAISVSSSREVLFGSTEYFRETYYEIYDWVSDVRSICSVDDLI